MTPFCRDCKHVERFLDGSVSKYAACRNPRAAKAPAGPDLVTGERKPPDYYSCREMRKKIEFGCRPKGRWFEPLDDRPKVA